MSVKVIHRRGQAYGHPVARKERKEGDSPFHFDSGKSPVDLLPPVALMEVARILGYGAKKYGDWNWVQYAAEWTWGQLIGSTLRHIFAWMRREDYDPESGHPHLAHAATNLLMLLELVLSQKGVDNRNPLYQRGGVSADQKETS